MGDIRARPITVADRLERELEADPNRLFTVSDLDQIMTEKYPQVVIAVRDIEIALQVMVETGRAVCRETPPPTCWSGVGPPATILERLPFDLPTGVVLSPFWSGISDSQRAQLRALWQDKTHEIQTWMLGVMHRAGWERLCETEERHPGAICRIWLATLFAGKGFQKLSQQQGWYPPGKFWSFSPEEEEAWRILCPDE